MTEPVERAYEPVAQEWRRERKFGCLWALVALLTAVAIMALAAAAVVLIVVLTRNSLENQPTTTTTTSTTKPQSENETSWTNYRLSNTTIPLHYDIQVQVPSVHNLN